MKALRLWFSERILVNRDLPIFHHNKYATLSIWAAIGSFRQPSEALDVI